MSKDKFDISPANFLSLRNHPSSSGLKAGWELSFIFLCHLSSVNNHRYLSFFLSNVCWLYLLCVSSAASEVKPPSSPRLLVWSHSWTLCLGSGPLHSTPRYSTLIQCKYKRIKYKRDRSLVSFQSFTGSSHCSLDNTWFLACLHKATQDLNLIYFSSFITYPSVLTL